MKTIEKILWVIGMYIFGKGMAISIDWFDIVMFVLFIGVFISERFSKDNSHEI